MTHASLSAETSRKLIINIDDRRYQLTNAMFYYSYLMCITHITSITHVSITHECVGRYLLLLGTQLEDLHTCNVVDMLL